MTGGGALPFAPLAVDEKTLGGIAAITTLLVICAVVGRLHGTENATVKPIGDRVAAGLLAIPLISVAVRLAFPSAHIGWALAAPVPLGIYLVLLAGTDMGWGFAQKHFTRSLLIGIGLVYAAMALVASVRTT